MKAEPSSATRVESADGGVLDRSRLGASATAKEPRRPVEIAAEVAQVLAAMTYPERVRAYRSGALSAHELALAAGWFPEQMPLLNGEYEWIAINAE